MTVNMQSIVKYGGLIKSIPISYQSTKIKKKVWGRFSYNNKDSIEASIFGDKDEVEISRKDIFSEADTAKRIVMVLMWGYPTGGRGSNIEKILLEIDKLTALFSSVYNPNLTKDQANNLIKQFEGIRGLGISTWTKLLYFFNIAIDSKKCQIYDLKIVDSLNKKQFIELGKQIWRQDIDHYYQYIELLDNVATQMCVSPEQVELFLFYFNLYYKFPHDQIKS